MFIHWGLYAVTGVQDQVYARMNWPREKYEALIHEFNPVTEHLTITDISEVSSVMVIRRVL